MRPIRTLILTVLAVLAPATVAQAAPADRVMLGGAVYTADRADRVHEAIAIDDGVIVYVGSDRGARRYVGRGTHVTRLRGGMVMPGLHDGHIHGISAPADECSLNYEPLTVADFLGRITRCLEASDDEEPQGWLQVSSWYQQFVIPSGTVLTKETLDALPTRRPIIVKSSDGHTALVNSRALALAGITANTPNPADGRIEHTPDGQPTGLLQDGAQELVERSLPEPAGDPVDEARRGLARLAREGITSFFVPGFAPGGAIAPFEQLRRQGDLTARAHFAAGPPAAGAAARSVIRAADRLRARFERPSRLPRSVRAWRPGRQTGPRLVAGPGISIDGVKLFLDGVVQAPAQTAALLEPYAGSDSRGELYMDNPGLGRMIAALERAGYQPHIHAIGDRAVRTALDGIAQMRRANGRTGSRPSIAHAELVSRPDLPRFAELGAIAVMSYQWAKPAPDSTDSVLPFLGPDRVDLYEPEGQLKAAGARIAFGSDFPVDGLDEFFAVEVAVLRAADWGPDFPQYAGRLNADPGLTLTQALRGITIEAARQMHQDRVTGSLERGKLADLIVLDRNLFEIPEDDISETRVLTTMVGGRVVHSAR